MQNDNILARLVVQNKTKVSEKKDCLICFLNEAIYTKFRGLKGVSCS